MKLIKQTFEILEQQPGIEGVYEQIELASRTCYKSEDKITEDSAKEFVDRMIKSGHRAMLEHGTVYLKLPAGLQLSDKYEKNKYSIITLTPGIDPYWAVTTNYRVLVENNWLNDLQYICEPTEYHERRVCARFVCDRGISHEFVRHRVFSFAQESTRYCNYSKDKFGNEITFIKPCFLDDSKLALYGPYHTVIRDKSLESIFIASLNNAEKDYIDLIDLGWKPQEARTVLPNALKTELVMTGFVSDWKHFFELRCASNAHPQAREIATALREEFVKRGYIKTNKDKEIKKLAPYGYVCLIYDWDWGKTFQLVNKEGTATCSYSIENENKNRLIIHGLYVDEEFRRNGIGNLLIDFSEILAKNIGNITDICLRPAKKSLLSSGI